jgi:colicin import membrane protein
VLSELFKNPKALGISALLHLIVIGLVFINLSFSEKPVLVKAGNKVKTVQAEVVDSEQLDAAEKAKLEKELAAKQGQAEAKKKKDLAAEKLAEQKKKKDLTEKEQAEAKQKLAAQKKAELKRKADAELKKKKTADQKALEKRKADEKRKAEQKQAEQKQAELKKVAEKKRIDDEKRKAEATKLAQQQKLEEEKRQAELARIVEEQKKQEEARRQQEEQHRLAVEEQQRREAELEAKMRAEESQRRLSTLRDAYILAIRQKIERNWIKPAGSGKMPVCELKVIQGPGGLILDVTFGSCSGGTPTYRASIENAVYKAEPLPKPGDPALFERDLKILFSPSE